VKKCVLSRKLLVVLSFSSVPTCVFGQTPSQADRGRNLRSPDLAAVLNTNSSLALARFSSDDKSAEARIALLSTSSGYGEKSLTLSLGGPISKSTGSSFLIDETGLRSSTNVGFNYSQAFFSPGDNVDPKTLSKVCERYIHSRNCSRLDLPASGRQEFDAASGFNPPTLIGFSAQMGRADFEYVNPLTPDQNPSGVSKNGYSIATGIGRGFDPLHSFISVDYRLSRSFKGGDEIQLCRPQGAIGVLTCSQNAISPPKERKLSLLSLEGRSFFSSFAIDPKFGYDFQTRKWRVDAPIYLFRNEQGGFIGGLLTTWVQGEEHLGFAVFIGRSLGVQIW
jgi:hypothetical protein